MGADIEVPCLGFGYLREGVGGRILDHESWADGRLIRADGREARTLGELDRVKFVVRALLHVVFSSERHIIVNP
jgi:hypothetical protein